MEIVQNGVRAVNAAENLLRNPNIPLQSAGIPKIPVETKYSGQYHYEFIVGYDYEENGTTKIGYTPVVYTSDQRLTYAEARDRAFSMLDRSEDVRNKYNVPVDYNIRLDKTHLLRVFYGE